MNTSIVFKTGARTRTTLGTIAAQPVLLRNETLQNPDGSICAFTSEERFVTGHLPADSFAAQGDSGALVFDQNPNPIGMVWGGMKSPAQAQQGSNFADGKSGGHDHPGRPTITMKRVANDTEMDNICFVTPMASLVKNVEDTLKHEMVALGQAVPKLTVL